MKTFTPKWRFKHFFKRRLARHSLHLPLESFWRPRKIRIECVGRQCVYKKRIFSLYNSVDNSYEHHKRRFGWFHLRYRTRDLTKNVELLKNHFCVYLLLFRLHSTVIIVVEIVWVIISVSIHILFFFLSVVLVVYALLVLSYIFYMFLFVQIVNKLTKVWTREM